jgi:acetyltransferase EpsM
MTEIILVGAGGNCKKIIDIILKCNYTIKGILDDKFVEQIEFYRGIKIIGIISNINKYKDYNIVVTIGTIAFRRSFFSIYSDYRYINIIHPGSCVSESSKLGKGIIIHYGVYIGPDTIIGDYCHLDTQSIIEHDCILCNNVLICPKTTLCGGVKVCDNVFVGAGTTVINSTKSNEILLNESCFIGAGSLINKSIDRNILYYGTPLNYVIRELDI